MMDPMWIILAMLIAGIAGGWVILTLLAHAFISDDSD